MANAYVVYKAQGEFSDYREELLSVVLDPAKIAQEIKRQAELLVEEEKPRATEHRPITITEYNNGMKVMIGKMGWGPEEIYFYHKEVPLAE